MKRAGRRAVLAALVSLLAVEARAQAAPDDYAQPVQELFISQAAYVQDAHETQLTTVFDYRKSGDEKAWVSENAFQYGITDRLEFDVTVPFVSAPGRTGLGDGGLGDIGVGLAYGVSRRLHPLAVTVGVGASLTKALEAGLAVPLELTGESKDRGLIGIVTFSF